VNKRDDELIAEAYGKASKMPQPVHSSFIFFPEDNEVYLNDPHPGRYKRLGDALVMSHHGSGWTRVRVATGEDVAELTGAEIDLGRDGHRWFVVDHSFPHEQSFPALVSKE